MALNQLTPSEAAEFVFDQVYFPIDKRARLDTLVLSGSEHSMGLDFCRTFYYLPSGLKSFQVSTKLKELVYNPLEIELREVKGDHTPTDYAFLEQLGLLTMRYRNGDYLPLPF